MSQAQNDIAQMLSYRVLQRRYERGVSCHLATVDRPAQNRAVYLAPHDADKPKTLSLHIEQP